MASLIAVYLCRQFKEQLRNDAATANEAAERGGYHQQPRLTASALARMQQLQQGSSGAENTTALPSSTTRSLYDVKAMQKEAVLSYVKVIYNFIFLFDPVLMYGDLYSQHINKNNIFGVKIQMHIV